MQKHGNPNIRDVCVDTFMIIGRMVLLNCCGAAAAGVYIDSGAGAGRSRAPGSSSALSASCISEYQRHNTDTQGAVFLQQMVTPTPTPGVQIFKLHCYIAMYISTSVLHTLSLLEVTTPNDQKSPFSQVIDLKSL